MGQETIARLITYNGVKQQLWGVRLQGPAKAGIPITHEGQKAGKLTSVAVDEEGAYGGLGYILTRAGGLGLQVDVGGVKGEIVEVPYLSHSLPSP